jgi:hypothetical protein
MIRIRFDNHLTLAKESSPTGSRIASFLGMDVHAKVDKKVAEQVSSTLASRGVRATVRIASRGVIEVHNVDASGVGGVKGFFATILPGEAEQAVADQVKQGLRAAGVRGSVIVLR